MKRFVLMLGAIAAMGAAHSEGPTREQAVRQLHELAHDVESYREIEGRLPSSLDGLAHVASRDALLADPWGNDVFYLRVAGGFWLMSWGADGEPGGDGDAADVVHIAR